jgi:hypothetical protein
MVLVIRQEMQVVTVQRSQPEAATMEAIQKSAIQDMKLVLTQFDFGY